MTRYPITWQVVEERVGSSSDPERQFVWGLRYVDDLVLRDWDTDDDGTFDERLYGLQDANWNVTAIADAVGAVQERYAYSAYGSEVVLDGAFTERASSSFDWEIRFAGYRWDLESRLYYVRNRVLHPNLGVWVQRDPLGLTVGINLYQYVQSSPLTYSDARGLFIFTTAAVVVAGLTLAEILAIAGISILVAAAVWRIAHCLSFIPDCVARAYRHAYECTYNHPDWLGDRFCFAINLTYMEIMCLMAFITCLLRFPPQSRNFPEWFALFSEKRCIPCCRPRGGGGGGGGGNGPVDLPRPDIDAPVEPPVIVAMNMPHL